MLPEYLGFSGFPFPLPPSTPEQPFPTLRETHSYLQAFSAPFLRAGAIKLSREVVSVVELEDQRGWDVTSRDWTKGGAQSVETWDAVVVSVGWFDNPVWPATEGLTTLREAGLAHHAKWWRGPQAYSGKVSSSTRGLVVFIFSAQTESSCRRKRQLRERHRGATCVRF